MDYVTRGYLIAEGALQLVRSIKTDKWIAAFCCMLCLCP